MRNNRMIKLSVFLYALLLCPLLLTAQAEDNYFIEEDFKNSFGLKVSYDQFNYDFNSFYYSNRINFTAGLIYKRRFNSNLEFNTGLLYSEKGYAKEAIILVDLTGGIVIGEYLVSAAYIAIPLNLGYRYLLSKRLVIVPNGGFVYSALISKSVSSEDIDVEPIIEEFLTQGIEGPLFAFNVALGIEWHLKEKYFFVLEPYFRNWFRNMNQAVIASAPTSYGIGLSFNRKF